MSTLRAKLIRLAHENPAVREHILPLLKEAAAVSDEEMKALQTVAKAKGAQWKSWLMDQWSKGVYPGFKEIEGELQTLRNKLGPAGLKKLKLEGAKTAAVKGSMSSHIEAGLLEIAKELKSKLAAEFSDAIKFTEPSVTSNLHAGFEGEIEWQGEPAGKSGFIMVLVGLDQFDLQKANVFLNMDLPSGKKFQKEWGLTSGWMSKSADMVASEMARALGKNWIDPFLTNA